MPVYRAMEEYPDASLPAVGIPGDGQGLAVPRRHGNPCRADPVPWPTADVQSELDRGSHALTGRIRQLAERDATPLPKLGGEVAILAARVDEHLKKMGFPP
jgi:hypothetical protein